MPVGPALIKRSGSLLRRLLEQPMNGTKPQTLAFPPSDVRPSFTSWPTTRPTMGKIRVETTEWTGHRNDKIRARKARMEGERTFPSFLSNIYTHEATGSSPVVSTMISWQTQGPERGYLQGFVNFSFSTHMRKFYFTGFELLFFWIFPWDQAQPPAVPSIIL